MWSRAAYLLRYQGPGDRGRWQAGTQGSGTLSCFIPAAHSWLLEHSPAASAGVHLRLYNVCTTVCLPRRPCVT